MKKTLYATESLLFVCLAIIACSRTSEDIPLTTTEQESADTTGRGQLSSIDDYLRLSYTGEQWIEESNVRLKVDGLVELPLEMDYARVLAHDSYSKVVSLNCIDGWSIRMRWEGVLVEDLLKEAGIKESAYLVIFNSYDGYQITFMLKDVLAGHMMLAYKVNGSRLPLELGFPFQLVAEDKPGFNWVKGVSGIEIR